MVPRSSGIILLSLQAWAEERDEGAWGQVLAHLPAEAAQDITGTPISTGSWYATSSILTAIHTVGELFGFSDFHERYGEYAADFVMTRLNRFIARFTSPIFVVSRAGRIWSKYHDTGRWTIDEARHDFLRGTLHDFGVVDGKYCDVLTGWIRRMGQLTGAENNHARHVLCRATGADGCTWESAW